MLNAVIAETPLTTHCVQAIETPGQRVARGYDELWKRFLAAYALAAKTAEDIREAETQLTGSDPGASAFSWEPDDKKTIIDVARNLMRALVQRSEKSFAGAGAKLSIDTTEIYERWIEGDRRYDYMLKSDFLPSRCWAELESRFGGDAGKILAYQQAADFIVRDLRLEKQDRMRQVGGSIELKRYIYTEDAIGGGRHINYNHHRDLVSLAQAMCTFLAWEAGTSGSGGETPYAYLLKQHLTAHHNYSDAFTSRTRYKAGPFEIIYFYEKMILRIENRLAARLNEFLSQFSERLQVAQNGGNA